MCKSCESFQPLFPDEASAVRVVGCDVVFYRRACCQRLFRGRRGGKVSDMHTQIRVRGNEGWEGSLANFLNSPPHVYDPLLIYDIQYNIPMLAPASALREWSIRHHIDRLYHYYVSLAGFWA